MIGAIFSYLKLFWTLFFVSNGHDEVKHITEAAKAEVVTIGFICQSLPEFGTLAILISTASLNSIDSTSL